MALLESSKITTTKSKRSQSQTKGLEKKEERRGKGGDSKQQEKGREKKR